MINDFVVGRTAFEMGGWHLDSDDTMLRHTQDSLTVKVHYMHCGFVTVKFIDWLANFATHKIRKGYCEENPSFARSILGPCLWIT